jgi:hypothetical protein
VLDGFPTAEVAADLGVSENAILQVRSRNPKRLRAEAGDLLKSSSVFAAGPLFGSPFSIGSDDSARRQRDRDNTQVLQEEGVR